MHLIFGPPGTGKTERLLRLVEEYLKTGKSPERIGLITFTKKAATEAKKRAMDKFNLPDEAFPYFRTLHSLAFRLLGTRRDDMIGFEQYREISDILGTEMTGQYRPDKACRELAKGDQVIALVEQARAVLGTLRASWEQSGVDISWEETELIADTIQEYKKGTGMRDFTDLIEQFNELNELPELDLLLIDEAQDINPLQWKAIDRLTGNSKQVIAAGDDDQAIYSWAGADTKRLLGHSGTIEILHEGRRLPKKVHDYAVELSSRITQRKKKEFISTKTEGTVSFLSTLDSVPLESGEWYILARNDYLLKQVEELCKLSGYRYEWGNEDPARWDETKAAFTWEELRKGESVPISKVIEMLKFKNGTKEIEDRLLKEKQNKRISLSEIGISDNSIWHLSLDRINLDTMETIISMLRRKEKLVGPARIHLSTIHGVKGGERQNVTILGDMSYRTWQNYEQDPDSENRVFYVGATRAKENLCLIQPETAYGYQW